MTIVELRRTAILAAKGWNRANATIAKAQAERQHELWRFLTRVVKIARAEGRKSSRRLRRLIAGLNSSLDAKAVSRYARIVRAAIKSKPTGVSMQSWVKSRGGIARFR
jgi:hypothetical protein